MSVSDMRYQRLGYVALNVTQLERSRTFYEVHLGLTFVDGNADRLYLRCSDRHHDVMLCRSDQPGLKRVGWQMESAAALQAARDHMEEIGLTVHSVREDECADLHIGEAFRTTEPTTGATFEFYVDMEPSMAFEPTHTKIERLGHIVLNSVDRTATEAFMADHMNFRVSDRIDKAVTFMRCFPNPFHHSLGVGQGAKPGLNHVNFMVSEMADVGKACNRMKANDVPIVFGIGKHPPSESVFLYFLDPDGMTIEYSFGMEEFPEEEARAPRDLPLALESIDYWGGTPDPRSGKVGELERLS